MSEKSEGSWYATHAHCPRCNSYEPIVWSQLKIWQPGLNVSGNFEGMELKCRTCEFIITKIGRAFKSAGINQISR